MLTGHCAGSSASCGPSLTPPCRSHRLPADAPSAAALPAGIRVVASGPSGLPLRLGDAGGRTKSSAAAPYAHRSIPDPVPDGSRRAFEAAHVAVAQRVQTWPPASLRRRARPLGPDATTRVPGRKGRPQTTRRPAADDSHTVVPAMVRTTHSTQCSGRSAWTVTGSRKRTLMRSRAAGAGRWRERAGRFAYRTYVARETPADCISAGQRALSVVPPVGFEPTLPPPEGGALSPELRGPVRPARRTVCSVLSAPRG